MKKTLFLSTCILSATIAHAKMTTFDDSPKIISLSELSLETIQEFTHSKDSDYTIEIKEGAVIPLQFLAKSRVLSILIDPNLVIKTEKTCYLRVVDKKCYMSEDLIHWEKAEKFMDGKAVVQLKQNPNKPGFILEADTSSVRDESSFDL